MEAVIDTNVLVYDTIEDSAYHEDAREKLSTLKKWVIPTVVLEEFCNSPVTAKGGEKLHREKNAGDSSG